MTERTVDGMRVAEFGFVRTPLRRRLVDAILTGEKTSTTGLVADYESGGEAIPRIGERFVLLGYDDEPVAVIETIDVRLVRVRDVDLEFARDEGEGFETLEDWFDAHVQFFSPKWTFDADTEIIAERFKLVSAM
jgi:uncharacterized protein YhfF